MAESITIVLLGVPVSNLRHRTTKSGRAYTPKKTADERTRLKLAAQQEMLAVGWYPFQGPLRVEHRVERPVPLSFSKRKRLAALAGEIRPTQRPDFDNYAKMVDALNGIVWLDDSQICLYGFIKTYSEQPKVIFKISPFPGT